MKKILALMTIMLTVAISSFSQGFKNTNIQYNKKGVITDYAINNDAVYSVGENLIIGEPTNNGVFQYISTKNNSPVSGDIVLINRFYIKDSTIMAEIISNKVKYNIPFKTAIESGELLSKDEIQKRKG